MHKENINYSFLDLASLNKQNLKIYINVCNIERVHVPKIYAFFSNDPSHHRDIPDAMH